MAGKNVKKDFSQKTSKYSNSNVNEMRITGIVGIVETKEREE